MTLMLEGISLDLVQKTEIDNWSCVNSRILGSLLQMYPAISVKNANWEKRYGQIFLNGMKETDTKDHGNQKSLVVIINFNRFRDGNTGYNLKIQ